MHCYSIYQGTDGKWYTNIPDSSKTRGVRQLKRKTREEIEEEVINYWINHSDQPTIEEVFNRWNDRRLELKKVAPGTHVRDRQIFNRHFADIAAKHVSDMSIKAFTDFLEEQIPKHELTSKAFSGLRHVAKGIIQQAKRQGVIDYSADDVFSELDLTDSSFKKVVKEDYEEVFDEQEMDTIINYVKDSHDLRNLGILLMFVTGLRVGEVVALKKADISGNVISVRRTETKVPRKDGNGNEYIVKDHPKTQAGVRSVVIPSEFTWLAKKLCNTTNEFVFTDNGVRLTTNTIRKRLTLICRKTGVFHKSPHKIRKTYGTILLDNSVDDKLITGQMGHTNISCTETHYHRNRRNVAQKSEILSNISDFKKYENTGM